jgi:prevent-host-death family protein
MALSSKLTLILTMVYNMVKTETMIEVAISEFKAKCLALLEQVRRTRKPIRITRHGKPVAEIVPPAPAVDRSSMIGSMKGSKIIGDIVSPANDEDEWEALRD